MERLSKIEQFESMFSNKGTCVSKRNVIEFKNLLDEEVEDGVNDFSVSFHRTPFDYCDGYYVVVKVDGKYNIVYYYWSQYSGYNYVLVSDKWFDDILVKKSYIGTCEFYKHGHIEYDSNWGRGTTPESTIVPVVIGKLIGFVRLQHYGKKNVMITEELVNGFKSWNWNKDLRSHAAEVTTATNERMWLTENGHFIPIARNLRQELEDIKKRFTDKDVIVRDWIMKDRPCTYRYGFSFKGAGARRMTKEKALEDIKKYSFGMGFYEISFEIDNRIGDVVLNFNEFSESDLY